jgi:hypothetical protein
MASELKSLSPSLEMAILRFWAQGLSISQQFSEAEIKSVPGLAAAIDAIGTLPAAIGRDDDDDLPVSESVLILTQRTGHQPD